MPDEAISPGGVGIASASKTDGFIMTVQLPWDFVKAVLFIPRLLQSWLSLRGGRSLPDEAISPGGAGIASAIKNDGFIMTLQLPWDIIKACDLY